MIASTTSATAVKRQSRASARAPASTTRPSTGVAMTVSTPAWSSHVSPSSSPASSRGPAMASAIEQKLRVAMGLPVASE